MKFIILNGSTKNKTSMTMQYVQYIQKKFPQHELRIIDIVMRIRKIEEDHSAFQEILQEIETADGVLWAFPIYYCMVIAGYKRFIELIFERQATGVFQNKYTATLSTSIHFFDYTAHYYMNAICDDLNMKYFGSFSAAMMDLFNPKEQARALTFMKNFFAAVEQDFPVSKTYPPIIPNQFKYTPGPAPQKLSLNGKRMLIIADAIEPGSHLAKMISRFQDAIADPVEVADLSKLKILGGCQGCSYHCGYDSHCVYENKDDYIEFHQQKVKKADIVVFAGTIKDRFLSSRWKLFFDRSFYHTHIPWLNGKQIGLIISGPLGQIPNLRHFFELFFEQQSAHLADIVTDEYETSAEIDALFDSFVIRIINYAGQGFMTPPTFLSIAGNKLLRDAVWGELRPFFRADHRYYQKTGFYDFPQKNAKVRILNFLMVNLLKIPPLRRKFKEMVRDGRFIQIPLK